MNAPWPEWRKVSFRFFFIYLILQIAPWTWLDRLPWIGKVTEFFTDYYYQFDNWAVTTANQYIFHVRPVLIPQNGSGDTSQGWAQVWLYLSVAVVGALVWTLVDRKRGSYQQADYWLRTFVRYFIALHCFGYGILKLFSLQMFFPTISQMITPLGDFLPMRFSWMFMGYSTPYQVFSGAMETIAGLLLLNRKTVTLGLLFAGGVFANVFMMNLSYDIPVKIFSAHLFFYSLYLLAHDAPRLYSLLVLNKGVERLDLYDFNYSSKGWRIGRIIAKVLFISMAVVFQTYNMVEYDQSVKNRPDFKPIPSGLYDVKTYVLNGDTIPGLVTDTVRWKDMVFERGGGGSVGTTDTLFWQRYRRGYFSFKPDTVRRNLRVIRRSWPGDTTYLFTMHYDVSDRSRIKLWTKVRNDSLYIELERSKRHFQLAEKQFHFLSEYNR
jgi:hypothetical protein